MVDLMTGHCLCVPLLWALRTLSAELACLCHEVVVGILGDEPEPGLATEGHPGSVPSFQFLWSRLGLILPQEALCCLGGLDSRDTLRESAGM